MKNLVKKQQKVSMKIRIETWIIDQLDADAAELGISRDELITRIINYKLAKLKS